MTADRYRAGVMDLAEREAGLVVQFVRLAGIYELPRSDPDFDRAAALLREALEAGTDISFETRGNRIFGVE